MRFAHIADTHIRNLKYHFEYREVFSQLYTSLKDKKVDYIIHCGDIAHTKTQISPEFVDLCRDFFVNLSTIAPTYIILGNHDGNLRNSSRQDAISPIIKAINSPNLVLLKDSGETRIADDYCLNVLSVFDEESWVKPSSPDATNIALYHGAINKSKTDLNWSLEGDHEVNIFEDFDFAFLGDIHKTQQLDDEGRIRYAGSTVQQNFGESLDKGYLLWDIENKDIFNVEHISFVNPKPFITINLTKKGNLPRVKPSEGARLRIVSEGNVSLDKVRKAVDIAKFRYNPESVTYLNRAAGKQITINAPGGFQKKDLRDLKTQEELMQEYLKDYDVTDEVLKKVFDLNKKYNTQVEESEDTMRNIHWSLKSLEWDYLFNYGEGNCINFEELEGVVGIFGKNYSGKSSIVDSLLYAMYNSTSKSIRKNLNIINQHQDTCKARAIVCIDDVDYVIERESSKYIKRLHGVETQEAKTDLEFYKKDLIGNTTILNGTSRQDTDKNIRKYFGSFEDFLLTSMASQLDSLAFINEGSTKRKEILAKFLDLEIFDKKFRMSKEDSAFTSASLKRLEGIDFEGETNNIKADILKSELRIASNKARCSLLKDEISNLVELLKETQDKIESVPAEVIDPVVTNQRIEAKRVLILRSAGERKNAIEELEESEERFEKIEDFLAQFDISSYQKKKSLIDRSKEEISLLLEETRKQEESRDYANKKRELLQEVPCGSQYPSCKFIKDAHDAIELIQITEVEISNLSKEADFLGNEIRALQPEKVEGHINKYNQLVERRVNLATSVASSRLKIERVNALLFREQVELEQLEAKTAVYEENKEAIENLKGLMAERKKSDLLLDNKENELNSCEEEVMILHNKHGSFEQKLVQMRGMSEEYEALKENFAAHHLLMVCCHPNGIAYDIIKERLPIINQEIAKILTNIVEFEIFIQNDDKKLDIFIKHPSHDPRPLEMGSGAEKTIASMAIRLAFLTVSSLPKSDLFILDEPGTALDEENMEGFVRILDMIKSYFKTVILISHLDNLKDCVDMQIAIEKKGDYAHVYI
jgi:DNA repair exonuclease SbcCD ATPase subunit/DNA repair exonuclease SbcCD nuclease subunit